MKLSKRLSQIFNLVSKPYDDIWDCCCDHGLLGFKLLNNNVATTVHFVDRVPSIIDKVEYKLLNYYQSIEEDKSNKVPNWQVHTLDMACQSLPIKNNHQQLIVIAGIGGDLLVTLINKLMTDHGDKTLEFIICPVHHEYEVRAALTSWSMNLINEKIVFENKRFYQVLHVVYHPDSSAIDGTPIESSMTESPAIETSIPLLTLTGSTQWDFSNTLHQQYLDNLLTHYTTKLLGTKSSAEAHALKKIVNAYESLSTYFVK